MGKRHTFCADCGSTNLTVYFPTPESVARTVLHHAKVLSDRLPLSVLEPSAGTGNLARLAAQVGAEVDCVEIQPGFADQLVAEGIYRNVWCNDFLKRAAKPIYDRILMNPPFENGADMEHVERAVACLKPGGILVAVMSSMAGQRRGRKDKAFATRLTEWSASETELPRNAFADVGTNTACKLVRIQREEAA